MQISSVSSTVLTTNSNYGDKIAQLQQQVKSLQEQATEESQSDHDTKTKQQKIELLQSRIQQLQQQIQQLRSEGNKKESTKKPATESSGRAIDIRA